MARNLDEQMDLFKPLEVLPTDDFGNIQEPLPDINSPEYQEMRKDFAKDVVKGSVTSPVTGAADIVELGAMLPESNIKGTTYDALEKGFQALYDLGINRENAEKLIKDTTGIELEGTAGELTGEVIGLPVAAATNAAGAVAKAASKYGPDAAKYLENITDEAREIFRAGSGGDDLGGMLPALATAENASTQTQKMLDKPDLPDTSISPTMVGATTEPGRKAIDDYEKIYDDDPYVSKEELFAQTGVYQGRDGKYRYELDTTNAKLVNPKQSGSGSLIDSVKKTFTGTTTNPLKNLKAGDRVTLGSVLDFPELYSAYNLPFYDNAKMGMRSPKSLDDVPVQITSSKKSYGSYYPGSDRIEISESLLSDPDRFLSTLLHEVQHAVQKREGFTSGANTREFLDDKIESLFIPGINNKDEFEGRLATAVQQISNDEDVFLEFQEGVKKVVDENPDLNNILDMSISNSTGLENFHALRNVIVPILREKMVTHANEKELRNPFEVNMLDLKVRSSDVDSMVKDDLDFLPVTLPPDIEADTVRQKAKTILRNTTPRELKRIIGPYLREYMYANVGKDLLDTVEDFAVYDYLRKYGELEARLIQDRTKYRKELYASGYSTSEIESEMRNRFPPLDMTMYKVVADKVDPDFARNLDVVNPEARTVYHKVAFPEDKSLLEGEGFYFGSEKNNLSSDATKSAASELPPPEAAQKTQIATTGPTYAKAKTLLDESNPKGKTLDFGAGRGLGAKEIGADTYEPFPREGFDPTYTDASSIPDASYEKLTSLNVLNVVPRDMRDGIVKDIGRILKPNGQAIVTTRGRDVLDAKGKKGPEDMSIITSSGTYQKGFTQKELTDYVKETLGEGYTVEPVKGLGKAGVKITKYKPELMLNEGGAVPMKRQMELFNEGGLADEGNTIDPVSGNDVPVGSTQEEVRDDIPAQLSEGEFVLPADVVRFHGLEKIMQLRDEAKRGLQKMEDMGQMGNSEEAILDDDVPFDINDLDMEDDGVLEYNQGGVVQPQGFTGIGGYQPSQFTNYVPQYQQQPVTTVPSVYTPPQQAAVPTAPTGQAVPNFQTFMQAPQGQAPENREYINPQTQERRTFTFINNQSTVAIPEGFIPVADYKPTEAVTSTTTTPTTTQVTQQDSSGDDTPQQAVAFGKNKNTLQSESYTKAVMTLAGQQLSSLAPAVALANTVKQQFAGEDAKPSVSPTQVATIMNQTRNSFADSLNKPIEDLDVNELNQLGNAMQAAEQVIKDLGGDISDERRENIINSVVEFSQRDPEEEAAKIQAARDRQAARDLEGQVYLAAMQNDDDDSPSSSGTSVNDISGVSSRGSGPTPGGYGGTGVGRQDIGMNKGGSVTKQMKKSGLTSKK